MLEAAVAPFASLLRSYSIETSIKLLSDGNNDNKKQYHLFPVWLAKVDRMMCLKDKLGL